MAFAAPASAEQDADPQAAGRTWLALGDSYSAGTGITGTLDSGGPGRDCRRADGNNGRPRAWAVSAFEQKKKDYGLSRIDFVPCSGAITDDAFGYHSGTPQYLEAQYLDDEGVPTGNRAWDIVSFTFGGNNARFADVLAGCLDANLQWGRPFKAGCDQDETTLDNRVDQLTRVPGVTGADLAGSVDIPALLDQVAEHVKPGGQVIMVGYPRIFSGRRFFARHSCAGILKGDYQTLDRVVDRLDDNLKSAVDQANTRHTAQKLTFTFVDIRDTFDDHGLCASTDLWMNGTITSGIDYTSWYHPNQQGHDAMAAEVEKVLKFGEPASSTPAQPEYQTYTNSRYGFSVELPASYTKGADPTNGDGLEFHSSDGRATVTMSGSNNTESLSVEQALNYYTEGAGWTQPTYQNVSGNRITASGLNQPEFGATPDNTSIFYEQYLVGPGSIDSMTWNYPQPDKDAYDAAVAHAAKTFQSGDLSVAH